MKGLIAASSAVTAGTPTAPVFTTPVAAPFASYVENPVSTPVVTTVASSMVPAISATIGTVQTPTVAAVENTSKIQTTCGPKLFCAGEIAENKIKFLIDTGSQVNIVSIADLSKNALKKLEPSTVELTCYDGSGIDVIGMIKTTLHLGSIKLPSTTFFVVGNTLKAILGTPTLKDMTINLKKMVMTTTEATANKVILTKEPVDNLSSSNFNIKSRRKTLSEERRWARLLQKVTIPAKTEMMVRVGLEKPVKSAITGATDTQHADGQQQILIGKSISNFTPNQSSGLIGICNISNDSMTLNAGQRMTKFTETEVAEETGKQHASFQEIMKEIRIGDCPKTTKEEIKQLLFNYHDVFASSNGPISQTDRIHYDLHTSATTPIAQQKYKTPYYLRGEMQQIIEKNIKQGLMEPCSSP